jgi:hypothetical protein
MPLSNCSDSVKDSPLLGRCLFIGEPALHKIGRNVKMANRGEWRRKRGRWIIALTALTLSAPILTGCSSTPTTAQHHVDPLLGHCTPPGQPPLPNSVPKAVITSIPAPPQTGGIPPLPNQSLASNPAALAGQSGFQVSLAKPLAIDDQGRPQAPGQLTARSQPLGYVPPNPHPTVVAVPDVNLTTPTGSWQIPPSNVPPALPTIAPANALRQQLQARGVLNEKVDPVPEGIRLSCYLPRSDGQGLRLLEAEAADYATAAQAILRQLEP